MDFDTEGGGAAEIKKWMLDKKYSNWIVLVLAIAVVLLLVVLFITGIATTVAALKAKFASVKGGSAAERFGVGDTMSVQTGASINNAVASTFRNTQRQATEFSGTNQVPYNASSTMAVIGAAERLTATNSAPDFWTVSDELGRNQDRDRLSRGDLGENQYWSPDLQLWLTSSEVKQLPAEQAARVQFYGNQAAAPAGQVAAVERFRNTNALLQERMNTNALLSPEERMMSDMISSEYRAENLTPSQVDNALMSRLGSGM